ncbi:MAG: cysteine desulfurase family protein, partial [Bdellovibrionales bacterium]
VLDNLGVWANQWGNPSSIHQNGRGPKNLLREARAEFAKFINAHPLEIVFTSGGSVSNNAIIKGYYYFLNNLNLSENKNVSLDKNLTHQAVGSEFRNEYITSRVEHPSVLKSFADIERLGAKVHYLNVNREGRIDLESYKKLLSKHTALVSVMFANNETGSLFPIAEMVRMAHEVGAKFHTDAVQALGKVALDIHNLDVDFASFSGHKMYSLRGSGVIFSKKGMKLQSLISGGGQERGRRAGTENILAIASLGQVAKEFSAHLSTSSAKMKLLRDEMESLILKKIPDVQFTGVAVERLPNTSSLLIENIDGESLLLNLDLEGFSVSTGAACSSGSMDPSPVLLAMGLTRFEAQKSLRVSLGCDTTSAEIEQFVTALVRIVERLRSFRTEKVGQ